jgi:hypothetical protein
MKQKQAARPEADAFAQQVEGPARGFMSEYLYFLRHNKKFWLTPVLIVLALLGVLIVLGGSGAAPLIYALF